MSRIVMPCFFAGCLLLACAGQSRGQSRGEDLIEFVDAAAAQAFGWTALDHTKLIATSDSRVGRTALRVEITQPADYRGVDLACSLDLTGARPNDRIIFHVKQNFGTGMRVQICTDQGPVNRSFRVTQGEWTRVELDLDLANWENPQNVEWGKINRIQFYEKPFAAPQHHMILDGLSLTVQGRPVTPLHTSVLETWIFPQENATHWILGNQHAAWAITKSSGQVTGGWNAATRESYLVSLEGRYHLEDRQSLTTARELDDRITEARFDRDAQCLEVVCANAKTPDLVIRKRYWIEDNRLFQRISFVTRSEKLQFLTFNTEAIFEQAYRDAGFYMGGGDGGWPLVPAPPLSTWRKVTAYRNTTKGMVLHQPEKGYSFAHIRTRLDDQFVWPWYTGAIASYCETMNVLHYTPSGWDMSLGTSRLSTTHEISYEQYVTIFEGDWQRFLTAEYPALAPVRQAYAEIPPTPDWVAQVITDTSSDMERIKRLLEVTDEGYIMVLVDMGGSWADYYVDEGLDAGPGGGNITAEELKDLITRIKSLSPRVKVGLYMWNLSTFENTRIFKNHPEWFRKTSKSGEPLSTFPGFATNYAHLLSIPGCYEELVRQFDIVLGYLDTDFIYLDDPKAINPIDWDSGEYTRDDLSFRMFLDIKRIAARHGPDKMVFFNNMCNPYADINYIEGRGELNARYWRHFAGNVAIAQTQLASRPDARIVLLYYVTPYEREYINRILAMGWIPEMVYGDELHRRAFVQAAYELGNSQTAPVRYDPDWKRDKNTNIESYAVRRRGEDACLLSFISHEEVARAVPVTLDLDTFDLDPDRPVFIWEYVVEDAGTFRGQLTETLARLNYAQTGWTFDQITRRRLLYAGSFQKALELTLPMEPLQLHQLHVSNQPAGIYSENHLPGNYLLAKKPHVSLTGTMTADASSVQLHIDCARDSAEVVIFAPLQGRRVESVLLDDQPVTPRFICEGEQVFAVVAVTRGRHTLTLTSSPADADIAPVRDLRVELAGETLRLAMAEHSAAIIAIDSGGRLHHSASVIRQGDDFALPLPPVRPEARDYNVTVQAVVDATGQVRLAQSETRTIALSACLPADVHLDKPPDPIMPGRRALVEVQRTIQGIKVLRSATSTTDTLRGSFQPRLEALVATARPDDLYLEAGTTRKLDDRCRGAAFAGFEFEGLRQADVRLKNTFHDAFHFRGSGIHVPPRGHTSNFAGLVVDYHTPAGYSKRVALPVGVMHQECSSTYPDYGKHALADEAYDLGSELLESPEATFRLDLERHAPADWDGRVWLSVGTDWIASDRRLSLEILAVNDDAVASPREGTDPKAYKAAYDKPKTLRVPRSPGGIVIDGTPNEEMWRGAAKTERFFLNGGVGVSKASTDARILYDHENLYVAFVCAEPARSKPAILGGALWDDDEIEIWIDANRDHATFRQIIVNAANERMEFSEGGQITLGANSAVYVDEGVAWSVELAIPFAGLGVKPPKPGDAWGISLCRYRPPGKSFNSEQIVWAPLGGAGFKDLKNFGTLVFE